MKQKYESDEGKEGSGEDEYMTEVMPRLMSMDSRTFKSYYFVVLVITLTLWGQQCIVWCHGNKFVVTVS
jgi:hypothetical protein